MALSEEDTASIAAQLTIAWSNIESTRHGVGSLSITEGQDRIFGAYERFQNLLVHGLPKHRGSPRS